LGERKQGVLESGKRKAGGIWKEMHQTSKIKSISKMSKQTNVLLIVLALAAFAYFIYELVALPKATSVGYACLFLGSMINLYRHFKNKKEQ
jgi:hypothetical protein